MEESCKTSIRHDCSCVLRTFGWKIKGFNIHEVSNCTVMSANNTPKVKSLKISQTKKKELELFFSKTPFEFDLSSRGNDDRIPGECLIVHCIIEFIPVFMQ